MSLTFCIETTNHKYVNKRYPQKGQNIMKHPSQVKQHQMPINISFYCLYCEQHNIGKFGYIVVINSGLRIFSDLSHVCLFGTHQHLNVINSYREDPGASLDWSYCSRTVQKQIVEIKSLWPKNYSSHEKPENYRGR